MEGTGDGGAVKGAGLWPAKPWPSVSNNLLIISGVETVCCWLCQSMCGTEPDGPGKVALVCAVTVRGIASSVDKSLAAKLLGPGNGDGDPA
jgi:hypothetical protein